MALSAAAFQSGLPVPSLEYINVDVLKGSSIEIDKLFSFHGGLQRLFADVGYNVVCLTSELVADGQSPVGTFVFLDTCELCV